MKPTVCCWNLHFCVENFEQVAPKFHEITSFQRCLWLHYTTMIGRNQVDLWNLKEISQILRIRCDDGCCVFGDRNPNLRQSARGLEAITAQIVRIRKTNLRGSSRYRLRKIKREKLCFSFLFLTGLRTHICAEVHGVLKSLQRKSFKFVRRIWGVRADIDFEKLKGRSFASPFYFLRGSEPKFAPRFTGS